MTMATLTGAYRAAAGRCCQKGSKVRLFGLFRPIRSGILWQAARDSYVGYFEQPAITGLTAGHDQACFRLSVILGLMYAISSTTEPDYLVDHSASIVLINPQGQLVGSV